MQVKVSQASRMMTTYIRAGLVPFLVGSPGIGKSHIIHALAKYFNLKVIDVRLSQCDPTDLLGFPNIKGNKAGYVPMDTFPIEGDPIPEGYSGWMLFFDEFNGAPLSVQKAAYKVVLDKMIGNHHLHKNVAMVCAGNLDTDNAAVEPMSTALQSRMVHLELVVDAGEFVNWAAENDIDYRITSQINFKPGNLYTFKADHSDNTYACPRTWEFANRLLKLVDETDKDFLPLLAGTLSEGVAREFVLYCKIHESLPKIPEIVAAPDKIMVPEEPSIMFALTGSISHNATKDNITPLMQYVNRLPKEFQVVCMRETIRRNKPLLQHAAIQKWISTSAVELF
jgi:hypothetical protein